MTVSIAGKYENDVILFSLFITNILPVGSVVGYAWFVIMLFKTVWNILQKPRVNGQVVL